MEFTRIYARVLGLLRPERVGPGGRSRVYSGRDRTFFFVSYEAMRERQGLVFNNIVPTAPMKAGDYSARGLPVLYDPLTTTADGNRTPFTGNVIPRNRIAPQATFYNQYVPDPNTASGTAVEQLKSGAVDIAATAFDRQIVLSVSSVLCLYFKSEF